MSKKGVYGGFMSQTDMRQAIKTTALELLVRHGYRGTSFGDIAAERATTRANIHYHFGGKQALDHSGSVCVAKSRRYPGTL